MKTSNFRNIKISHVDTGFVTWMHKKRKHPNSAKNKIRHLVWSGARKIVK